MEQMSLISKKKGERIDKFLGENLDDLSRSYIQKLLKDGPCEWEKGESKL